MSALFIYSSALISPRGSQTKKQSRPSGQNRRCDSRPQPLLTGRRRRSRARLEMHPSEATDTSDTSSGDRVVRHQPRRQSRQTPAQATGPSDTSTGDRAVRHQPTRQSRQTPAQVTDPSDTSPGDTAVTVLTTLLAPRGQGRRRRQDRVRVDGDNQTDYIRQGDYQIDGDIQISQSERQQLGPDKQ